MSAIEITPLPHSWWLPVIHGLFAITFGIVALFLPLDAAVIFAWIAGILILGEGIVALISAFSRNTSMSRNLLFFYAICSVFIGLIAIVNPLAMAGTLLLLLAIWLVLSGTYRIISAIKIKKLIRDTWFLIISGLLAIAVGIMLVAQPLTGIIITTVWFGITTICYGVFQIVTGFQLRKN